MRYLSAFTASLLCAIPALAFANCFSIYSPQGQLVYRTTVAPIDLSLQISEGLQDRFPNHHLVFVADDPMCTDIRVVANAGNAAQRGASGSGERIRLNDSSLQPGGNSAPVSGYSRGSGVARTPGTDK